MMSNPCVWSIRDDAMAMLRRNTALGSDWLTLLLSLLVVLALGGCATTYPMMPTPTLYTGAQAKSLFTDVPAVQRTPPLDLLYITDRAPPTSPDDVGPYTSNRSRSIAFGSTTVDFGEGLTWDTLVSQSTLTARTMALDLKLGPTTELGRYPGIPYRINVTPAGISRAADVVDEHEKADRKLQAEVARRLAIAPRKELVLFVHGYHNTFQDAALTMGELCHYLGREFVCAIFTWPAGGTSGLFFGYQVDRESSEFAVEDLRKTIRTIAGTPGLQKIHLLGHSRGTDVLATAVSELSVEAYMTETSLSPRFKISNLVLMAPDIDADVAPTKIFKILSDPDLPQGKAPAPRGIIPHSPEFHITMYVSPDDKALATSSWLFGSLSRLGRVDAAYYSPQQIEQLQMFGAFDIIQAGKSDCFVCHSYFVSNPRVSSDIIAMLRYRLTPNQPGRPLIEVEKPFWRLPTDSEAGAAK
jgi:esterase/lipase superfamily enzyme